MTGCMCAECEFAKLLKDNHKKRLRFACAEKASISCTNWILIWTIAISELLMTRKKVRVMARYIDSEILLKKLFPYEMLNDGNYGINAKAVKMAVENTPTADVVEVVRCKDCVHSLEIIDVGKYICTLSNGLIGRLNGTEYCSYGARREKEK